MMNYDIRSYKRRSTHCSRHTPCAVTCASETQSNSGGPLCDKCGRVAGVVRAVTGSVGGTYGAGISITDAMPFIRKNVPELAALATDAKEFDWPAVDAMVAPSTVLIMTKEDLRTDAGVSEFMRK